jgi:hypothetical protein
MQDRCVHAKIGSRQVRGAVLCRTSALRKIIRHKGVRVYIWPSHFPLACPPSSATQLSGTVYRFINGVAPAEKDFLSHYERNPEKAWEAEACKARGLSVLRTFSDCGLMRKAIPALRKKRVAIAEISTPVGSVAVTSSNSCSDHCTWWRAPQPSEVVALFTTVLESPKSSHA